MQARHLQATLLNPVKTLEQQASKEWRTFWHFANGGARNKITILVAMTVH